MVRQTSLVLAILGTLGLASAPNNAFGIAPPGSEAVSAMMTGAVLLLVAAVARRIPLRKQ